MTSMQQDGSSPSSTTAGAPRSVSGLLPNSIKALLEERQNQAYAAFVEQEFIRCRNSRSAVERQWYLNINFVNGRQYVAPLNVAGAGFRLTVPKAPPWRVRLVINKIRTAVRVECSKLTSSKPIPTVVPATTEDEDITAARVAEQILKSEFNTGEFDAVIRDWVWWGVVTGNSYIKSFWDYNAIDETAQPEPMQIIPGLPPMQPAPVKGKITYERVNPFHIYVPDLMTTDLEKQPYIIHTTTKHPLAVEKQFGFKPVPDSMASDSTLDAAVLSPANNKGMDSVIVKEMWLKPFAHADFPDGGVVTVINNRAVQVRKGWPWPFKEYPFYKYNGIPTGGFYTESVVTDLIPLQKEYNRTRSQIVEIKNTMGRPKLLYAKGQINPRQISSEPGQGIPYTPGFGAAPIIMPAAEVPSTMVNEITTLTQEFDDISGQHEISRGNTPNSQITSGTAITFLQEQDDSKLAYQVASIEAAIQKLGTHYLKYASHYWNDQRLIRIVGRDGDFEAKHWRGNDIRGNTDVRVQSGSALPVSKAARQALITEMMQNGWVDVPTGMEFMDIPGYEKILEDFLTDKRQAQRENMKLAEANPQEIGSLINPPVGPQGVPIEDPSNPDVNNPTYLDPLTGGPWQPQSPLPANSWDNHEAHIHFHNQFRKTQQFEMLDDVIKQAFEMHVQMHQMALMGQQVGFGGNVVANPQDPSMQDPNMPPEAGMGSPSEQPQGNPTGEPASPPPVG